MQRSGCLRHQVLAFLLNLTFCFFLLGSSVAKLKKSDVILKSIISCYQDSEIPENINCIQMPQIVFYITFYFL